MTVHCFTSFNFGYLNRALVLADTLRAAHPDWIIWALIVDRLPVGLDLSAELSRFDRVRYAHELDIPDFETWIRKHNVVEACTAVKGQMLRSLLAEGADKVIYLDPDIAVFHPLDGIAKGLERASIILTPHQVDPNEREGTIRENEISSLKYGTYNLGFVAVANDENGRRFADWWARMLYLACFEDVPNGIFTDQKWCDLVPALFDGVKIERDPGYNVASWNLSRRKLTTERGNLQVNGRLLKFYHFTKIDKAGLVMTEKYAGDDMLVYEICSWYLNQIRANPVVKAEWAYKNLVHDGYQAVLP